MTARFRVTGRRLYAIAQSLDFDTKGMSNGGPEAINGVIETTCRLAHGFRYFTNYRIRVLTLGVLLRARPGSETGPRIA
ncbi:transposase [Streptomyces sp. NPDC054765]